MRRRIRNAQGQTVGYEPPAPLPEPRICPVFSQKVFEQHRVDKRGNFSREGFLVEKVFTDGDWIPTAYARARKPVADPAEVQPLDHSLAELEQLYEKARCWVEEQDIR
jgi:hypothetical protein